MISSKQFVNSQALLEDPLHLIDYICHRMTTNIVLEIELVISMYPVQHTSSHRCCHGP